jgi:adenylate cyclase
MRERENMTEADHRESAAEIAGWLIADGRLSPDPVRLVAGFCERLTQRGVPLWRLRAGQRLANPLAAAWGVIWTRGASAHEYLVARTTLSTDAFHGSPFQFVVERRASFRRRLQGLDAEGDHQVLHEMAAAGGTDYLAVPLEYGDGSVQGLSLVSDGQGGFADWDLELIERLRQPLAAAMEPTAMRRSSASLLRTFLGDGPADAVLAGAIRRGDRRHIEAAILFCDLRGFTTMSEGLGEADLFAALDRYFEAVVEAVRGRGGDVLKFLGDGVLAIFPVETAGSRTAACRAALGAVDHARRALAEGADVTPLAFIATLHVGQVVYGNIGSPDRLDFTVLGPAVNLVSRLEGLAKELDRSLLCSADFAGVVDAPLVSLGRFPLKGFAEPPEVFAPPGAPERT